MVQFKMRILVTGAAGFIGFHLCRRLLADGVPVLGVDSLNDYYSISLKRDRLVELQKSDGFRFGQINLVDRNTTADLFAQEKFATVVHLAAQAGVRYSLENPHAYVDANLVAFVNVLEGCRHSNVKHLVFASSSSVYGSNTKVPFSEHDPVDHPVSLYAATKKAGELLAHSYSHLYHLPITGLRFFTVYGPWGRPDMAMWQFTEAIVAGKPIDVYNRGQMQRDFTYVDDVVEGVIRVMGRPPQPNPAWRSDSPDPATSDAPYRVYNIGNHRPVQLEYLISLLERCVGKQARRNLLPMQPGDVPRTFADVEDLARDFGIQPTTTIEDGVARFVEWFIEYQASTAKASGGTAVGN